MSNSDNLIKKLSAELKPFRLVRPSLGVAAQWCLIATLITALVTFLIAPFRPGVLTQLVESPRYATEIALGALLVFLAAWNLLALSIPGQNAKLIATYTVTVLLALIGLQGYSYLEPSTTTSMIGKRPFCFYEGLIYGFVLIISLMVLARRRAPFGRLGISALSGIAAVGITSTLMNLACMYEPYHIFTHHFAPVLPLSALALFLSAVFIRKI